MKFEFFLFLRVHLNKLPALSCKMKIKSLLLSTPSIKSSLKRSSLLEQTYKYVLGQISIAFLL